ncbi:MAG: hypothetical protein HY699_13375 [Deltaproteobacteria bacterium]|nr:hypothetical protein [Deltaproteobacteria bacterium]
MAASIDLAAARRLLGADLLGPEEIRAAFDFVPPTPPIPYAESELAAAAPGGEMLLLRVDHDRSTPLSLSRLIERFPAAFDSRLLRNSGYLLKDEWGIALEPLAGSEHCSAGWVLVRKQVLDETRNLPYDEQDQQIARYAADLGLPAALICRRSAVEIAYDLIVYHSARGVRLLGQAWDWSTSRTLDNGYLNVGSFGENGMQILSYSPPVHHGALGVCPVRLPAR